MKHTGKILSLCLLLCMRLYTSAQQVQVITDNETRAAFENKSYIVVKSLRMVPGFHITASQDGAFYAKVHAAMETPTAPTLDQNFHRQEVMLKGGVLDETQVRALANNEKATDFSYIDGIGRSLQSVAVSRSPQQKDVVQAAYFDTYGRISRQYLPYVANATQGAFRPQAHAEQASFYNNATDKIADDTKTYSEITYDNSPLDRVMVSNATGAAWSSKSTTGSFKINDAGTIQLWQVVNGLPASTSTYPAGTLRIAEIQDEELTITKTYTDAAGQIVLRETQAPGGGWARTYYLYTLLGKILFVIPPQAASTLNPDATFVDRWCTRYEYDEYQRQVGIKMPGIGWMYTIYDQWDRAVLTQDANQRAQTPVPEWSFVKYDEFNRAVITGAFKTSDMRATLTAAVANSHGRYESSNTTAIGYTLNQTFPATVAEADLLSISYYDNYSFLQNAGWDAENNSFAFVAETGFASSAFPSVKDLATGGKVRVLGSNLWLNSATYYDDHYRVLQTISEHHMAGIDRATQYTENFTNRVTKSLHVHTRSGSAALSMLSRFDYDVSGRMLKTYHKVNSQPEVILTASEYNELGQQVDRKLHSTDNGASWLQSVDMRYGIRGWLTGINSTAPDSGDPADYLSMTFGYENALGTGNTQRYDGLVTGVKWKSDLGTKEKVYNYTYDKGALTSGAYKVINGTNPQANLFTENNLTYDLNGNIQSLNRNAGNLTATTVDQLTYNYGPNGGNQLMKVTDATADQAGFKDGNTTGDDYAYDDNGNLKQDLNKGISSILYNALNLPTRVNFSDNSYLLYKYNASGAKLGLVSHNSAGQPISTIDYVGSFIYVDGQLQTILSTLGRLVTPSYANLVSNSATREANTTDGFTAVGTVTITREVAGQETYVKAVSGQSGGTPGIFPMGGTIAVKAGETYSFKVLGYQSSGTNAGLHVWGTTGNIVWAGATLPVGSAAETWVTSTFTVPPGVTEVKLGVLWNGAAPGSTFYINRIALYKTDWEYQYFLTDHQGSNRAVLQTTPHAFTHTATMETDNFALESTQFFNLNSTREVIFSGANATAGGTQALKMDHNYKIGPSRSFRVLPGDAVDASVMAFYPSGGAFTKTPLANMAALLLSVLTSPSPALIDGVNTSYTNSGAMNPNFVLSPDQGGGKPSAFLNYILFDDTYTPIEAKSAPLQMPNTLHSVALPRIDVKTTGFLLIYLSYDNEVGGGDVFFDDLRITYTESALVQVNDFYPFGRTAFSWVREGENENVYLYQNKEYDSKTGLHDFHARQYDATLGRWWAPDPAGQFASPYLFGFNNPICTVDPDGRWAGWDDLIVSAVGFIYGYVSYGITHGDWGAKALANGAMNAAMFELGYLTMGGGLAAGAGMGTAKSYLISSAVNIAASQMFPPIPIYQDNNFSLSVSPTFSMKGAGIGVSGAYRKGEWTFSAGVGIGSGGQRTGYGGGVSYFNGKGGAGYSLYSYSGAEKQRLGEFSLTAFGGRGQLRISNDFFPAADGGDRWRTGGGQLSWDDYTVGFLIHTGDPTGPSGTGRPTEMGVGKAGTSREGDAGHYTSEGAMNKSQRSGVVYAGYKNFKAGWNSDGIRHVVQNVAIHDNILDWFGDPSPWFYTYKRADVPSVPYFEINNNNPFSLWGY